jgi:hypothetical protein
VNLGSCSQSRSKRHPASPDDVLVEGDSIAISRFLGQLFWAEQNRW